MKLQREIEQNLSFHIKIDRYAKKIINYGFDFETIIDNKASLIENVQVSIDVEPGLYLKDKSANIEYRPAFTGMQKEVASSTMDTNRYGEYVQYIEKLQGYTKSSRMLDPGESFHVKGTYSDSWILLHSGTIIIFAAIFSFALSVFIAYNKKIRSHCGHTRHSGKHMQPQSDTGIIESVMFAFGGSFLVVVSTISGILSMKLFENNYQIRALMMPLLLTVIIGANILFIFGPSSLMWKKHGTTKGILTFGLTIGFIILLIFFLVLISFLLNQPRYSIMPIMY
ncbi:MAG: hypothetical protein V1859_01220 [archaeon]